MKLFFYFVFFFTSLKAEVLNFVIPRSPPADNIKHLNISWFQGEKLITRELDENALKRGIDLEGVIPEFVLLYAGENFVCRLKVHGHKIILPVVKMIAIDVTAVSGGGIILRSVSQTEGFYHNLIGKTKLEIPMADTSEPIAISYMEKVGPIKQIGTFSIGDAHGYNISISNSGDAFNINVKFNNVVH